MDNLTLAADFPAASRERWLALVEGVLKGADFKKKLVARTYDGIAIEPLYPKAEAPPLAGPARAGRWRVVQRVDHPDPDTAHALALADLEGGSDGLTLVLNGAATARGFGLRIAGADDLDRALAGVMLDLIALTVETAPFDGRAAAMHLADVVGRRNLAPGTLDIAFGLDPAGDLARAGTVPVPFVELGKRAAEIAASLRETGFNGPFLRADGRPYHEAGASEAQELAAVLATGVAYLRALEANGHSLDSARDALSFLLVADADEFLTVAKFRALRRLWGRVEQVSGLAPKPIRLHGETAWRMTTRRDPWVNLLRGTIATFSAGIGGADAITVLPFTAALGLPDALARRLARNTQSILLEESNLWRVADPAAGSGGFEALTDALCETAWRLFQEIEGEGGIAESLSRGGLQARIAAVRERREKAVATRRDPLTGTSEFPNLHEMPVSVLMPASKDAAVAAGALPSLRSAEPFEHLRDRSDDVLARTGRRPQVFLANLGPISAFSARATFAKNFFEAGGIEAIGNDGFAELDDMCQAYSDSKAELICLCSSDEIYKTQAISAATALRAVTSAPICLAGRPGELEDPLRRAGVSMFIFAGCDTLTILGEALDAARS
jgi:methylmalonyl-CoA mutase